VPPKTRCNRVVIEKREKIYPQRRKANPGFLKKLGAETPLRSKRNSDRVDDPGGTGYETTKEVRACPKCSQSTS
jgi:hypothetical protein